MKAIYSVHIYKLNVSLSFVHTSAPHLHLLPATSSTVLPLSFQPFSLVKAFTGSKKVCAGLLMLETIDRPGQKKELTSMSIEIHIE
jgi:hypothetical protein